MPAYVVAWMSLADRSRLAQYITEAPDTIAQYGGRYLAKGPGTEALEGDWSAAGMAILEFPDRETAVRWYESDEYRPLRELRQEHADSVLIVTPDNG